MFKRARTSCSIDGSKVTGKTADECTIEAKQMGNDNYRSALQTQTFKINKGKQGISCPPQLTIPFVIVGETKDVWPSPCKGGGSNNPISFLSSTPTICLVNGDHVQGVAVGRCIITANQDGDKNYERAQEILLTLIIAKSNPLTLNVSNINPSSGSIIDDANGINCGSSCNSNIVPGTSVTLTAVPSSQEYQFSGWGGDCSGFGNFCILTMDADKSVTAKFNVYKRKHRPIWLPLLVH